MNPLRHILFASFFAAILSGCEKPSLPEGGFSAKALLSEEVLRVGDIVTLTLTTLHPPESSVEFPPVGKAKEVLVRGRAVDTSVLSKGVLKTEQIIQLTSLRTGNWLVTTNPVICTFSDGTQKAQKLPTLVLNVKSTLTEKNATMLSDIKSPIRRLSLALWVLISIIAIALTAGLLTVLFLKRPQVSLAPEPVVPPHITACKALAVLKEEEWIPEPFFVKLSTILRTYLEDRFDLNAPESTTEELAGKLKTDPRLDLENSRALQLFFEQSDLVKFARAGAEQDVMQTAFSTVEQFIDQTHQSDPTDKNEIC